MKTQNKLLLFVLILLIVVVFPITAAWAVPLLSSPSTYVQPDGTTFKARGICDQWSCWDIATNWHSIINDHDTGCYVYAEPDPEGRLEKTSFRVGIDKPKDIKRGLEPKPPKTKPESSFRPSGDRETKSPFNKQAMPACFPL